jgi:hypothetical protein
MTFCLVVSFPEPYENPWHAGLNLVQLSAQHRPNIIQLISPFNITQLPIMGSYLSGELVLLV